jgi:rRNA maturation endonuclease Nob1
MNPHNSRGKLDLTIAKDVIQKAKKAAYEKGIPLSRLVENFLEFFINPSIYCFKCGEKFDSTDSKLCPKCGWIICPKCKVCRCALDEETAVAVFHMRRVYEDLLAGRVKES